ncbi:MAG TPA: hypothetical protein VJ032_05470 [Thermoanaerobaculia bacterium]|nr:hypothetical protein [Thermoanaerobaculia bacterium]
MQKSIAVLLIAMAAMSCRRHKEDVASTSTSASTATTSDAPLVGHTRKVEDKEGPKHLGPEIGTDLPAPGALINVPALVGRTRQRIEEVIGPPEDKEKSIYRVTGQPIHVMYEHDRAVWFELAVPWPVLNAVDALRLLGLETVNLTPTKETELEVDYTVDFSGVELDGAKITQLRGVATKPQTAPEWTDVGAGIRRPLNF